MPVSIASDVLRDVIARAAAEPDREVCGLLLGSDGHVVEARAAANVADDPRRRFEIDPTVQIAALRDARGGAREVLGNYHSHPTGTAEPSVIDAGMIGRNGELWLIVARGVARLWQADTALTFIELPLDACTVTSPPPKARRQTGRVMS